MVRLLHPAYCSKIVCKMMNVHDGVGDGRARRSITPGSEHGEVAGKVEVASVFVEP